MYLSCEDLNTLGLTSFRWQFISIVFVIISLYLTIPDSIISLIPVKGISKLLEFFRYVNYFGVFLVIYFFYVEGGGDIIDVLAVSSTWTSLLTLPALCY